MNPKFPQRCPEVPVTALRIELALTLPIRAIRIGARYIRIRADICNSRALQFARFTRFTRYPVFNFSQTRPSRKRELNRSRVERLVRVTDSAMVRQHHYIKACD